MSNLSAKLAAIRGQIVRPSPIPITFGEWLPDLPDLDNPGLTIAENVMPIAVGYEGFPSFSVATDALTARVRGVISVADKDGNTFSYAADATKIYALSGSTWSNVTGTTLDLGDGENLEFGHYGEQVIASYYSTGAVEVQAITIGAANFANLFTSTRKPRGRHIVVFKDFLILGGTYDTVDGAKPRRVWWSAFGAIADMDPAAATQCDFQDLPADDGFIERIIASKEYVLICMTKAIYRMTYQGGDVIFDLQKMGSNRGLQSAGAAAATDRIVFLQDSDGFYATDGTDAVPIGVGKVDQTFIDDLDPTYLDRVWSCIDPLNKLYMILYPGAGDSGACFQMLIYYIPGKRWAQITFSTALEAVYLDLTKSITLDDADAFADDIDVAGAPSLDSRIYLGGAYLVGAFNADHKLGSFIGADLDARIETGERNLFNGQRNHIASVWPYVDDPDGAAVITVQIGQRDTQSATVTYSTAASMDSIGKADVDSEGRYSRLRLNITGGFDNAHGAMAEARPGGWV